MEPAGPARINQGRRPSGQDAAAQGTGNVLPAGPTPTQRRWWLFRERIFPVAFAHLGLLVAPFCFSASGVAVALALLLLSGLGVTVGLHRLLTHRSFSTYRWVERTLATLGALAFQGRVADWVAVHRMHHAHSDAAGDPHSPKDSFWWGHVLWLFAYDPRVADGSLKRRYAKDLCKDPFLLFLNDHSAGLQALLFVVLFAAGEWAGPHLGLSWAVYGVCVRVAVLYQMAWLVNSASHTWGYRSSDTPDESRNCWWLAVPTLGEGWHNNHHAQPRSARFGLRWYEVDAGFLLIRLLQAAHLAWDVAGPKKA